MARNEARRKSHVKTIISSESNEYASYTAYYADKISVERGSHGNKFTFLLGSYDFTKIDVLWLTRCRFGRVRMFKSK